MRSYGQYCPVAIAAEVLGDRWTLLIVRELLHDVGRFNELERGLPGISRSILAGRLRRLVDLGLVDSAAAGRRSRGYRLTTSGRALGPVVFGLGDWAATWLLEEPTAQQLDVRLLMWWIRRHVRLEAVDGQIVVRFEFTAPKVERFWLVIKPEGASVCVDDPGLDLDLVVTADAATLYRVYMGRVSVGDAIRSGSLRLDGGLDVRRRFPAWFGLSRFSPAARAGVARVASA